MKQQHTVLGCCAALLTLSFFMNWINLDLGFFSLKASGAGLPRDLHTLMTTGDAMSAAIDGQSHGVGIIAWFFYLLYLIPLAGTYLAYRAFAGRPGHLSLRWHAVATGVVCLLLAGSVGTLLHAVVGSELSAMLIGNGYGLTLLMSLALIAVPFLLREGATFTLSPQQHDRVRQQGQQLADRSSDWLRNQREQLAQRQEKVRIEQVLGRSLSRDVLLPDDQVLASRGTIITHALVQQARDGGVLHLLMNSTEVSSPSV